MRKKKKKENEEEEGTKRGDFEQKGRNEWNVKYE